MPQVPYRVIVRDHITGIVQAVTSRVCQPALDCSKGLQHINGKRKETDRSDRKEIKISDRLNNQVNIFFFFKFTFIVLSLCYQTFLFLLLAKSVHILATSSSDHDATGPISLALSVYT